MCIRTGGNLWSRHAKVVLQIAIGLFVCQRIKSNPLRDHVIDPNKKILPAGTFLGALPKKIGDTSGPYLHLHSFEADGKK